MLSPLCTLFTVIHPKQTVCTYGTYCYSHSTVTIYAICNVTSHDKRFAPYIGTFRSSVQRQVWLFSVLPSCDVMSSFTGTFRYFVNDFEMVPVAPTLTGTAFVFTLHIRYMSTAKFLYFTNLISFHYYHY